MADAVIKAATRPNFFRANALKSESMLTIFSMRCIDIFVKTKKQKTTRRNRIDEG